MRTMDRLVGRARRAVRRPSARSLRVLFAEHRFPQQTQSYIFSDLLGLQSHGVEAEVWSAQVSPNWFDPGVRHHRDNLDAAIDAFQPDLVLAHWLHIGDDVRSVVRSHGLPLAVRGHGFEFHPDTVTVLLQDDRTIVQLYPHFAAQYPPSPRVCAVPVGYDPVRYAPSPDKQRNLVVRTMAGHLSKDLDSFLLAAKECPDHEFVAIVGTAGDGVGTAKVVARRDELESPAQLLRDLSHDECASWVRRAGIYVHTFGFVEPFGMPISIAESMGTGCYLIARDAPEIRAYVGEAGDHYDTVDELVALIQATTTWTDDEWAGHWTRSVERAQREYAAPQVAGLMLAQWADALGVVQPVPA